MTQFSQVRDRIINVVDDPNSVILDTDVDKGQYIASDLLVITAAAPQALADSQDMGQLAAALRQHYGFADKAAAMTFIDDNKDGPWGTN